MPNRPISLTCIMCPRGCTLTVDENNVVTGHKCGRGPKYAISELAEPKRELATTVRLVNSTFRRLPVKVSGEVSKEQIPAIMAYSNTITVQAPVKMGDVIVKNVLNLGVDLIATCDMHLK